MTTYPAFKTAKTALRFIALAALSILLTGCYVKTEPVSHVSVMPLQDGKPQGQARPLSPQSAAQLSTWLAEHRWGWMPVQGTFLPALAITLSHNDGSITHANLLGELLIVGDYQLSLSAAEHQQLSAILSAEQP